MSKSWRRLPEIVSIWTSRMHARPLSVRQASSKPSHIFPEDHTASLIRMSDVSIVFRVPSWLAGGGTAAVGMDRLVRATVTAAGGTPDTANRWSVFEVVALPGQYVDTR